MMMMMMMMSVGQPRIGIFAIKGIKVDEPLSYDYQFDTKEEEAFKCYCGTEKCRGGGPPSSSSSSSLSSSLS